MIFLSLMNYGAKLHKILDLTKKVVFFYLLKMFCGSLR